MHQKLLTMREAAEQCGVAKSTITRKRQNGKFPNAQQKEGTWYIPVEDLIAAGMLDQVNNTDASAPSAEQRKDTSAPKQELLYELKLAHQKLEAQRNDSHRLQQLLDEKERTITALSTALRALEPAAHPTPEIHPFTNTSPTKEKAPEDTLQRSTEDNKKESLFKRARRFFSS